MNSLFKSFKDLDIRVGTIIHAELFKESINPSYKLKIDFGPLGVLNSSAQITKNYQIKDLKEKQIIALVNVGKRKIANFESQCLVLGANHNDEVILLAPEKKIPNGQQVL